MFLKNKNIIFKIRRSKVTDYAALNMRTSILYEPDGFLSSPKCARNNSIHCISEGTFDQTKMTLMSLARRLHEIVLWIKRIQ